MTLNELRVVFTEDDLDPNDEMICIIGGIEYDIDDVAFRDNKIQLYLREEQ